MEARKKRALCRWMRLKEVRWTHGTLVLVASDLLTSVKAHLYQLNEAVSSHNGFVHMIQNNTHIYSYSESKSDLVINAFAQNHNC